MITSREISIGETGLILVVSDDKVLGVTLKITSGESTTVLCLNAVEVEDLKKAFNLANYDQKNTLTRGDK